MSYSVPRSGPVPWFCVLLAGCSAASATQEAPPPAYAAIASGRIDSAQEARHLVAERDGIIADVLVQEGDAVVAGQPLVRIACQDAVHAAVAADAMLDSATADLRLIEAGPRREAIAEAAARALEAEIRARDARDALARAGALKAKGFVSARKLAELEADAAAKAAAETAARESHHAFLSGARPDERRIAAAVQRQRTAAAQQAKSEVAKCELRSPTAGTVLRVYRREGEFSGAGSGDPLVVVGALDRIMVRAEFVERDAFRIHLGAPVDVWLDGNSKRWRGRIAVAGDLMGRRTARSTDPAERFDSDVLEAKVVFDHDAPPALVGLRVNVGLKG
jgi:multidrug resistance efflux pump